MSHHQGIYGGTGSGKTSFARMMVEPVPRLLVLDHSEDQIWDTLGASLRNPDRAMRWYLDHADRDFQAVLRYRDPDAYLSVLGATYEVHQRYDLPPLVIVMEEATELSESWEVPRELERVVTRGRRHGLVAVTVAQETTQVHRTIRRQAWTTTLMFHSELSSDLQGVLTKDEQRRVMELEPLDPYTRPEYGRHYVTVPGGENPYRQLLEATASKPEPLPDDYEPPPLDL